MGSTTIKKVKVPKSLSNFVGYFLLLKERSKYDITLPIQVTGCPIFANIFSGHPKTISSVKAINSIKGVIK